MCCGNKGVDFDASPDSAVSGHWINASSAVIRQGGGSESDGDDTVVVVDVVFPAAVSGSVRYTAAAIFPQCALYNAEGLPALPFEMPIASSDSILRRG